MVKRYMRVPGPVNKTAKASGSDLRVHFKNTRNTVRVLQGMPLSKANLLLRDVICRHRCIPFKKFARGVGKTAQAREWHCPRGRWPRKSVNYVRNLLRNATANARTKGLDVKSLVISHIACNLAQRQRRRTYRAHGRINPFNCSPSHLEVVLTSKTREVKPPRMLKGLALKRWKDWAERVHLKPSKKNFNKRSKKKPMYKKERAKIIAYKMKKKGFVLVDGRWRKPKKISEKKQARKHTRKEKKEKLIEERKLRKEEALKKLGVNLKGKPKPKKNKKKSKQKNSKKNKPKPKDSKQKVKAVAKKTEDEKKPLPKQAEKKPAQKQAEKKQNPKQTEKKEEKKKDTTK